MKTLCIYRSFDRYYATLHRQGEPPLILWGFGELTRLQATRRARKRIKGYPLYIHEVQVVHRV